MQYRHFFAPSRVDEGGVCGATDITASYNEYPAGYHHSLTVLYAQQIYPVNSNIE